VLAVAAGLLALAAPAEPGTGAVTTSGDRSLRATVTGRQAVVTGDGAARTLTRTGSAEHAGVATDVYSAATSQLASGQPATVSYAEVARLNGGNLPIGLTPNGAAARMSYRDVLTTTAWLDPRTGRVVDLRTRSVVTGSALAPGRGALPLARPVSTATTTLPPADVAAAADRSHADADTAGRHSVLVGLAWTLAVLALAALLGGLVLARSARTSARRPATTPSPELVRN
jgi:high-affinity iron transporter